MKIEPAKNHLDDDQAFIVSLSKIGDMRYGIFIRQRHLKELVDAAKAGEFDYWLEGDWNSMTDHSSGL